MNLLMTEMRRALHRRAVLVLIAIALAGCALAGAIAYFTSKGKTVAQLRLADDGPAVMANWWIADDHVGVLSVGMFFLFLGGFFGGATVAGAEWRAGTITTVLTWEPRRLRLHGARLASGAILAFVISFALQVVFLASFAPAVVFNGTSDGVDGSFWYSLAVVMARTSVITAAAAVLAMSLATAARNTAFAVIAMFAWIVVIEGLIRALKPSLSSWLWGETVTTVMTLVATRDRRGRPRPAALGGDPCCVSRRDRRWRSDLVPASRHRRRHVSTNRLHRPETWRGCATPRRRGHPRRRRRRRGRQPSGDAAVAAHVARCGAGCPERRRLHDRPLHARRHLQPAGARRRRSASSAQPRTSGCAPGCSGRGGSVG